MQQNILLYSEAKTARPFWWSSLDFWVVWAFSRLTTSEDWPFRPLRGLKGQISGLSASLRPGQPRNLARQPKSLAVSPHYVTKYHYLYFSALSRACYTPYLCLYFGTTVSTQLLSCACLNFSVQLSISSWVVCVGLNFNNKTSCRCKMPIMMWKCHYFIILVTSYQAYN